MIIKMRLQVAVFFPSLLNVSSMAVEDHDRVNGLVCGDVPVDEQHFHTQAAARFICRRA